MEKNPPTALLRQHGGGFLFKVWQYFYAKHKNTASG